MYYDLQSTLFTNGTSQGLALAVHYIRSIMTDLNEICAGQSCPLGLSSLCAGPLEHRLLSALDSLSALH